jgi:hypothetical protein
MTQRFPERVLVELLAVTVAIICLPCGWTANATWGEVVPCDQAGRPILGTPSGKSRRFAASLRDGIATLLFRVAGFQARIIVVKFAKDAMALRFGGASE